MERHHHLQPPLPSIGIMRSPLSVVRVTWGRKAISRWEDSMGALLLIILCPCLVFFNWLSLENYNGSFLLAANAAWNNPPGFFSHTSLPTLVEVIGYVAWVLFQGLLYTLLPGPEELGQRTPGGHLLSYRTNGLLAWVVTHVLYLGASWLNLIDAAIVSRHWAGLLFTANAYGFLLAFFSLIKGYISPSFPKDSKHTGSWVFDFWGGIELNPRLGSWDIKWFHNGRPGIIAWVLIDCSWAAVQYQRFGYISGSMLTVLVLQTIYVIDFFYNEGWYARTIDISHDHFGFMLAWGDTTFLPSFYTLQAQFLARVPVDRSAFQNLGILAVGLAGYALFRSANLQRYHVRKQFENGSSNFAEIWSQPVVVLHVKYHTSDEKEHNSILLASGWWGAARHINYLADLIQAWAMCATCGFEHALPWSYFVYMFILLNHRANRDERRCRNKYGIQWDDYCRLVPCKFIPGIL